ncbi:MAG: agmatinase [Bacillota bacterium]
MFKEIGREEAFLGATAGYEGSRVVLVGAGLDATVCFRPGTREGPRAIRYYSRCLEEYSLRQDRDLREASFCDLGDVNLPFGDVHNALLRIEQAASKIVSEEKIPVFIGGEHLVTLPLIKAVCQRYRDIVVLHLDAHADLRDDYLGVGLSHATVMRRVCELLGPGRVYQFGIRSMDKPELDFARAHTRLYFDKVSEPLAAISAQIKGKPVYITLDMDVVDPAYAPGVGTPEPGGIGPRELMDSVYQFEEFQVVGFDLVEVSPAFDPGGLAPLLAAKVVRELVLLLAE